MTGWISSAKKQVAQKAIMEFQFLPSSSRHENIVQCWKDILRSLLALRKGFKMLPLILLRVAAIGNILATIPQCSVNASHKVQRYQRYQYICCHPLYHCCRHRCHLDYLEIVREHELKRSLNLCFKHKSQTYLNQQWSH